MLLRHLPPKREWRVRLQIQLTQTDLLPCKAYSGSHPLGLSEFCRQAVQRVLGRAKDELQLHQKDPSREENIHDCFLRRPYISDVQSLQIRSMLVRNEFELLLCTLTGSLV